MHKPYTLSLRGLGYTLLVATAVAITVAIYWHGLHGPFVLDDVSNLMPVSGWLTGRYDWRYVVFGNHSGLLLRPISMVTFLLDAAITHSMTSSTFKPTNLVIHVLCGLAMLWLAVQVFRHWQPTLAHARWYALALATAWLWLPLNVDTVLYIIQRMAQLAALFVLLALGCYMAAREAIERGRRGGQLLLWIGVPILTLLAALSKENGVLALPLALVLELFLFHASSRRRSASIRLFFVLTIGLPLLAVVGYTAVRPGFVFGGYSVRDFTLPQRLLTEPRVLWHYVQTLLLPIGRYMGFFQDNFPLSTGPLRPLTTLPALAAWLAVAVLGWTWRKGNPLFGAGVWFFLIGQSLESGPFSLELYFEHRNYLPSFGVLLAVAGLVVWTWQRIPSPTRTFREICGALLLGVLGLYAASTWGHVQSWRSEKTFLYAQNIFNPSSPRFQSYVVALSLQQHDLHAALTFIDIAARDVPPNQLPAITLWRFLAYCSAKIPPPASLYDQLAQDAHGRIDIPTERAMGFLADDAETTCKGLNTTRLAAIVGHWLDTSPSPGTAQLAWTSRSALARIVAASGNLQGARAIMQRAWVDSRYNSDIGILLFQLNGSLGNVQACREILAKLEQQTGHGDLQLDQAVVSFREALANGKIGSTVAPTTPPNNL